MATINSKFWHRLATGEYALDQEAWQRKNESVALDILTELELAKLAADEALDGMGVRQVRTLREVARELAMQEAA